MVTVRPTKLSYNTVINAYAKSMEPDAAIQAQDILMRMIKSFKTDVFSTIKPDVVTFSSVLNTLAKSKTVPSKGTNNMPVPRHDVSAYSNFYCLSLKSISIQVFVHIEVYD